MVEIHYPVCAAENAEHVGKEGDRRPLVDFLCGPEIPGVKLTPGRLFWRTPGKLQLLDSLRQNPHGLLLEVWGPRSVRLIGLRSRPILPLRGRDGHGVIPLVLAKGHKLLDVSRRAEAVLGEGNRKWGDRWVWRSGKTTLPPPGEVRPTSGSISRQARSTRSGRFCAMSTVGLVQHRLGVGQAQAGDAVIVLIRRLNWSRADLANCSHNEFNRWSRRFWHNSRGLCNYTASRTRQYLHALRQLASHLDWHEPIGLQKRLAGQI